MARLFDRPGASAKEVAQIGAVLGREFAYEQIDRVACRPDLAAALGRLTDAGLLFCRGAPPHATYLFKNTSLVQDAAYSTLLRGRRQELHARVAAMLEAHFADLVERQPELMAHHLTGACKEIWVEGADRYRNPDEDLPADLRDPAGRALCRPRAASGRRHLHRERADRDDRGARDVRPRLGREPLCSDPQARRQADCTHAAGETGRTRGAGRTQDRNRPALADDQPARHAERGRAAHRLHRSLSAPSPTTRTFRAQRCRSACCCA